MQLMSASDLEDLEAKSNMLLCTGKRLTSLKGKVRMNTVGESGSLREKLRDRRNEGVCAEFIQWSYKSIFMSYRTDRVEVVRTFQYNDSANDHFEREPYSVLFRSREEGGGKEQ